MQPISFLLFVLLTIFMVLLMAILFHSSIIGCSHNFTNDCTGGYIIGHRHDLLVVLMAVSFVLYLLS